MPAPDVPEAPGVPEVVVHRPVIVREESATRVSVDIREPDGQIFTMNCVLPPVGVHPQQVVDAMFVIGRLVAQRSGARLVLPGPVSAPLLDRSVTYQDVLREWYPKKVQSIPLDFEVAAPLQMPEDRGALCTFSGGVDSFFTVLEKEDELTDVVFVHGLDIPLAETDFRARVSVELSAAADEIGLPLMQVETNVRSLTDRYSNWGQVAHGPILASIAILLAQRFATFYIPGSLHTGARGGTGWGSHVITDRLNSTDYLSVVHHAADVTRIDKTARIAQSAPALRHLRVCYVSRTDYNCGACAKCVRTRADLAIVNATVPEHLFADERSLEEALAAFEVTGVAPRGFAETSSARARAEGRLDIVRPLNRAIKRYDAKVAKQSVLKLRAELIKDPEVRAALTPKVAAVRTAPTRGRSPRAAISRRLPGPVRRELRRLRTRSVAVRSQSGKVPGRFSRRLVTSGHGL